jgi:CheY-like chemotaxis protein
MSSGPYRFCRFVDLLHFRWNRVRYRTFSPNAPHHFKVPQRTVIGAVHPNAAKEHGVSRNGTLRVILVVEDEWLVRDAVVQALRDAGWHVIEASTAEDAIALMRTGHPYIDVVFTDIQLAGRLCGWDVAEHCRAARADFPVVYASGNAADRSRRVANSLFFDKPYSTADVVEACGRLGVYDI